jgi:hypothetical protein
MSDQQSMSSGAMLSLKSTGGGGGASGQPMTMESNLGAEGVLEIGGDPMGFFKDSLAGAGLEGFGAKGITDMINDSSMVKACIGSAPEFNKGSPGINVQPPTAINEALSVKAGPMNQGKGG